MPKLFRRQRSELRETEPVRWDFSNPLEVEHFVELAAGADKRFAGIDFWALPANRKPGLHIIDTQTGEPVLHLPTISKANSVHSVIPLGRTQEEIRRNAILAGMLVKSLSKLGLKGKVKVPKYYRSIRGLTIIPDMVLEETNKDAIRLVHNTQYHESVIALAEKVKSELKTRGLYAGFNQILRDTVMTRAEQEAHASASAEEKIGCAASLLVGTPAAVAGHMIVAGTAIPLNPTIGAILAFCLAAGRPMDYWAEANKKKAALPDPNSFPFAPIKDVYGKVVERRGKFRVVKTPGDQRYNDQLKSDLIAGLEELIKQHREFNEKLAQSAQERHNDRLQKLVPNAKAHLDAVRDKLSDAELQLLKLLARTGSLSADKFFNGNGAESKGRANSTWSEQDAHARVENLKKARIAAYDPQIQSFVLLQPYAHPIIQNALRQHLRQN